jgi:hypothetical protein
VVSIILHQGLLTGGGERGGRRGWGETPIHAHIRLPYHSDNESGPPHSQHRYKHQADSMKGAL